MAILDRIPCPFDAIASGLEDHGADSTGQDDEGATMSDTKVWGAEEFWGLGYDFDPQWLLTPEQRDRQEKRIDLC